MRERLRDGLLREGPNPVGRILRETVAASTPGQRALAFGALPVAVLLAGALPAAVQQDLLLHVADPSPAQLYLASFVHTGVGHLSHNVLSYLATMVVLFPLAVLAGRHRHLAWTGVLVVAVVPVVVSLSVLHVSEPVVATVSFGSGTVREPTTGGLSGVIAALVGAIPVFVAAYVRERMVPGVGVLTGATGLLATTLGYFLTVSGNLPAVGLATAAVGVALLVGPPLVRGASWESADEHDVWLVFLGLLLLVLGVGTGVFHPGEHASAPAHFSGLMSGFAVAALVNGVAGWNRTPSGGSR